MRRFDYDDSEDKDDVDNMFNMGGDDDENPEDGNMSDAEIDAMIHHQKHQEVINWMQVELVQHELDQRLIAQATRICEKGWFWKFKSLDTQLNQIAETYATLSRVINVVKMQREQEVQ